MVIVSGGMATLIVRLNPLGPAVCGAGTQESVALILSVNAPFVVGVPESKPPVDNVRPAGIPVPDHAIGVIPPPDWNWNEYGCPCVAPGKGLVLVMLRAGQVTVIDNTLVVVPAIESVTRNVGVSVSGDVGVPEINPPVLRFNPGGKWPTVMAHV